MSVAGQLAVGMRATTTASITADEPFYLLSTHSLATDGDLDLRDEYAGREYRAFWDGTVELWRQMEPLADGRLLSPHDPGLSVLVLPAYELGGLRGVQRFLVELWAAAMALAAVAAKWWGVARSRACAVAAVGVGAGAIGVVYSSQVYPEGPGAVSVAAVLAVIAAPGGRPRPWIVAAAIVALPWLAVKYVPVAAVLAAWWVWRFRDRVHRGAVLVAAGLCAIGAVVWVWWHLRVFGALTPYATNVVYAGDDTARIVTRHVDVDSRSYRLYGLFLDARFGLLRWVPVTALAFVGLRVLGRRAAGPAAVFGAALLVASFVAITMMGWWFPGRQLVVAFPALVVVVAAGVERLPRTGLVLAAWSVGIAAALAWSATHGGVRLAVDPFVLGLPLPPRSLFPDFRTFTWQEVAGSLAWAAAFALLVLSAGSGARAPDPAPKTLVADAS